MTKFGVQATCGIESLLPMYCLCRKMVTWCYMMSVVAPIGSPKRMTNVNQVQVR